MVKFSRIFSPMHNHAISFKPLGELLQILGQMCSGVPFYFACMLSKALPFGQFVLHEVAFAAHQPKSLVVSRHLFHVLQCRSNVNKLNGTFLSSSYPLHVHQARTVGARYVLRPRVDVPLYLVVCHFHRHFGLFYGEHTTKSTTFVLAFGLFYSNSLYQMEQVYNLVIGGNVQFRRCRKPQLPNTMAAVMHTHHKGETSRKRLYFKDVV